MARADQSLAGFEFVYGELGLSGVDVESKLRCVAVEVADIMCSGSWMQKLLSSEDLISLSLRSLIFGGGVKKRSSQRLFIDRGERSRQGQLIMFIYRGMGYL
ncbi:hypothetical protein ONS96_001225 [Cadophora gregata f. sp. sojae]|nr:hypothetical protein ONS96_001225 [Cadophora gregata f. sp. sojae]